MTTSAIGPGLTEHVSSGKSRQNFRNFRHFDMSTGPGSVPSTTAVVRGTKHISGDLHAPKETRYGRNRQKSGASQDALLPLSWLQRSTVGVTWHHGKELLYAINPSYDLLHDSTYSASYSR